MNDPQPQAPANIDGIGQPPGRPGIALQRHSVHFDNGQRGDLQTGPLGGLDELGLHLRPAQPHLVARLAQVDLHAVEPDLPCHVEGRRIAALAQRPVAGADFEAPGLLPGQQRGPRDRPHQETRRLGRSNQHLAARQRKWDCPRRNGGLLWYGTGVPPAAKRMLHCFAERQSMARNDTNRSQFVTIRTISTRAGPKPPIFSGRHSGYHYRKEGRKEE